MLTIRNANEQDIPLIRELTFIIWPHTYGSILSELQIHYMLRMMYNEATLARQMQEGLQFIICEDDNQPVGFAAYAPEPGVAHTWKLHKLYILPGQQGKGIGRYMIEHVVNMLKPMQAQALQLNVNRYNKAKQFYDKMGFTVLYEDDIDIGNGFFMNDYIMELPIR